VQRLTLHKATQNDQAIARHEKVLEGDAVRPDGTLKDASEMEWPHSPSDPSPPKLSETERPILPLAQNLPNLSKDPISLKRKSYNKDEADNKLPKAKVIRIFGLGIFADETQISRRALVSNDEGEVSGSQSEIQIGVSFRLNRLSSTYHCHSTGRRRRTQTSTT
jgi:hypothetical protein